MKDISSLRVAIVHDWLVGGGAESVVLELHRMFPDAPIYTSYCTPEWREKLDGKVVTGFLQHWPLSKLRKFLPVLRIWWFTHLNLSGYDLVISSSGNGEAKGVRVPDGTKHICYCHTPTHFYWRHYEQYMQHPDFGFLNPLARLGLRLLVGPLRKWDLKASKRPDFFIANSSQIQKDIKTYYGRESTVIHPPVDVDSFAKTPSVERKGFVTVGRQKAYKRNDVIVKAAAKLNVPLKVIGRGPDHSRLAGMAGSQTTFLTDVSDEEKPAYLAGAEAFLFAAIEDFGVSPVEAMAAGTPVIAYKAGGALDYVIEGKTGLFFNEQTAESLAQILSNFDATQFDPTIIREFAQSFDAKNFHTKMLEIIDQHLGSR